MQKCVVKILTALGRREWKTWNDVPLELRKDIERIHRNLGHASVDQLEKLFRDANVSDDAVSALKHFRCDACDRMEDHIQGISSCEDDSEGAEHRGCCIRDAHCDSNC